MDDDDLSFWGLALLGYLMASLMIYGTYWAQEKATFTIEQTECYDRYGSEIEDLVCDKIVYDLFIAELFSSSLFALMGAFMIFFLSIGIIFRYVT